MNIYVPPLEEGANEAQLQAHQEIIQAIEEHETYHNLALLPVPDNRGDLHWLSGADAMIAEATTLSPQVKREALYAGQVLGKHVLLLSTSKTSRDLLRNSFDERQQNLLWIAYATRDYVRKSAVNAVIDEYQRLGT